MLEKVDRTRSQTWDEVEAYQKEAARKSDFERDRAGIRIKTGVRLDGIEVESTRSTA